MAGEKDLEDYNNCQGQSSYTNMKRCIKYQKHLCLQKQSPKMATVASTAGFKSGKLMELEQPVVLLA